MIGIDTSPGMLALTRQAARERRVADRVVVLPADATDLPFPDESFVLVIALGLVPWVDDAGRLVRELARVTASGGHLILTADNRSRLTHALDPLFNPHLARLRRAVGRLLGRDRSTRVRVHRPRSSPATRAAKSSPVTMPPASWFAHAITRRTRRRVVHGQRQGA